MRLLDVQKEEPEHENSDYYRRADTDTALFRMLESEWIDFMMQK